MTNSENIYEVQPDDTLEGLNFLFVSEGKSDVIKVVNYAFVERVNEIDTYNLGFGDVDSTTNHVTDSVATENGDARKVFNTVLSTVPLFFEKYPDCKLLVKGSDSRKEFKDECRERCQKNCAAQQCRKFNQRIRIYRNFVEINLDGLNTEYQFFEHLPI